MWEKMNVKPMPQEARQGGSGRMRGEGFVDEDVVRTVLEGVAFDCVDVKPEEFVMSSSNDDYAGWALPVASPFREREYELDRVVRSVQREEVERKRLMRLKKSRREAAWDMSGWKLMGSVGLACVTGCGIGFLLMMGFSEDGVKSFVRDRLPVEGWLRFDLK